MHPTDLQPPNARVHQDYETKHNGLRHLRWQQQKDGLDIYGATFALNLTEAGEIVTVSSRALHLPKVRFHRIEKVTADEAIRLAKAHLEGERPREPSRIPTSDLRPPVSCWFPLDMLSAVLSWDILAAAPDGATHRLIVRADTGKVVEDLNLTWGLEPITLRVYTNDSPTPFSPGMNAPTNYTPPTATQALVTVTALDTNASPQGWVPDGSNEQAGNNVDAYEDGDNDDQPDMLHRDTGVPYRTFERGGLLTVSERQAFYWGNVFHDRVYALGFDEAAGNFQEANFGRGGRDADRMRIEVWNGARVLPLGQYNQANITVLNDGHRPRMQLHLWNMAAQEPYNPLSPGMRDSALDAEVIFHEYTHGLCARLIGDGYGLSTVQSRGMAEGWSDFVALSLLSQPSDDVHGCYAFGAYVNARADWTNNYYFGIRRFPYSTDMNKAPQTFADTDPNQMAFPPEVPSNPKVKTLEADEVHRVGEVWALALWECRANLIKQYGFAGNGTMLQLVVDGMKLLPTNPTFAQARDALLLADQVNAGGSNQMALWRGFAKRGLGYSATVPESPSTVGIIQAFDLPFDIGVRVAEAGGDGDGYIDPGEDGSLTVVLTNHEMSLSNVTATLAAVGSEVTVTAGNAGLPDVSGGGSTTSAPPFTFTVDTSFPGFTDAAFTLRIESDKGWFDEPVLVRIGNPYDYPPEILNVAVTNMTETNAWVRWTTGIPADGQVEYGTDTNYDLSTILAPVMQTIHMAPLTGLAKGTVYHFRIHSEGTNGLAAVSGDFSFRTRSRIYVNVNGRAGDELGTIEAPFKTLQAAAEAARTTADEVLVAQGTYTGTSPEAVLDLNGSEWNLTIRGGSSPDFSRYDPVRYVTVIDGQGQRRGIRLDSGATLEIEGVTIQNCTHPEWGGGVVARQRALLTMTDCVVRSNVATNGSVNQNGGGVYATLGSSVWLNRCAVLGNRAVFGGGVFAISSDTTLGLDSCVISGNWAQFSGGGVELLSSATATLSGCLVKSNQVATDGQGGGVCIGPYCTAAMNVCTVASNRVVTVKYPFADGGGGILVAGQTSPSAATLNMSNCIVYGNRSPFYGSDLRCTEYAMVSAGYSAIGDIYGTLTSSNHLIRADPLFANPAAGDFHLLYGSPCIDAGEPGAGGGTDMDGEPRPFGAAIDIGADEFTDADVDHMADYWELARFAALTTSDGTADGDSDALDDFGEYMHQTDPHDRDTDRDLALDGWEVTHGFNPLNRDQDNDGMWDGWEVLHNLNAFTNDAASDPDGDAANNLAEFTANTDPLDPRSVLRFLAIGQQWGGLRLDWQGGREAMQFLETSSDLRAPAIWTPLYALPPPTPLTNALLLFGVTNRVRFYRVRAERL